MIRDDDSRRTVYGYTRRIDVPRTSDQRGNGKEDQKDGGLLRVVGSMVLTGVAAIAGGAVLQSGSRSILNKFASMSGTLLDQESEWMKASGRVMASINKEADWLSGALRRTEGVVGTGRNAVSYFDTLTDAEKFSAKGISPDYLRRLAVSRAAAYARRAPYELPAAYVAQRFVIDRERTKQEIAEGRFNPLNPIDVLGDFSQKAAMYVAGDVALYGMGPLAKTTDRWLTLNSKNYLMKKAAVKVASQESIKTLLQYTDNARMFTRATSTAIKDIAAEADTLPKLFQNYAVPDHTAGQGMRRPVSGLLKTSRAIALDAGKRIAEEFQDERFWRYAMGHASETTPRAFLGTDLKIFSGFNKEAETGFFSEVLYGRYLGNVESNLAKKFKDEGIEDAGSFARQVVNANKTTFNRRNIVSSVLDSSQGIRPRESGNLFYGDLGSEWADSMRATLGRQDLNVSGLREALVASAGVPDSSQATRWVHGARKYAGASKDTVVKEFVKLQGRSKLDLRGDIGKFHSNKREHMAFEVMDALGIDMTGTQAAKTGDLWKQWSKALGDVDNLDNRTKAFLVNRGRAYDTPLGGFNIFGLRRLAMPEMVALEYERQRIIKGSETKYGRHARMFGDEFGTALEGIDALERMSGKVGTRRMLGERGLYMSVTGDVVDTRWLQEIPYRALEFVEREMKVPFTNFNPLSMFGVSNMMAGRGQNIRFNTARGGFFENKLVRGLDQDAPLFQVGKRTYGSRNGDINYIGDWTWFANTKTTMFTSLARKISGVPSEMERKPSQKRGFFGGRWFMKEGPNGQLQETWASKAINWLDFEQDANKSIIHKVGRRLQRAGDIRHNIPKRMQKGFLRPQGPRENPDFLPVAFEKMVEAGQSPRMTITTQHKRLMSQLGVQASKSWDEPSAKNLYDVLHDMGIAPSLDLDGSFAVDSAMSAIRRAEEIAASPEYAHSDIKHELQYIIRDIRKITGLDSGRVLDKRTLQSHADISATTSRTARVKNQIQHRMSELYLYVTRLRGTQNFAAVEDEIRHLYTGGMIDEGTFQKIQTTMAAVDMRASKRLSGSRDWLKEAQTVERVRTAIGNLVGPGRGRPVGDIYKNRVLMENEGGGIRGLKAMWTSTFGNAGWKTAEGSVIRDAPSALNPFQGSTWIGLPSFSSKMGFSAGTGQLGTVLSGRFVNESTGVDSSPGRALGGVLFGETKRTDMTMGTMIGTHLVSRVSEALDTVGLGLQAYKYSSPADLFLRGMIGKRALPMVAGIAAFDVLGGVPGVGKAGLMGAAATAVGPGLGMARSGLFTATGARGFFDKFSDVTNQDEDSIAASWSRTPQEEYEFWNEGEIPVRQGRWWILGNQRWKGGKVNYYRPNWYRTYMSDYKYDDTTDKEGISGKSLYGSRAERLMFGYDFSPGRILNPYHYENKHYEDRPYPVSGDYFTGPWGPLTPALNATIGNILKPKRLMHTEDANIAMGAPEGYGVEGTLLKAYSSGRYQIGPVLTVASGNGPGMIKEGLSAIDKRLYGSRRRSSTKSLVARSTMIADEQVATSASGGYSQAIVEGMNRNFGGTITGTRPGRLGAGKYSTGEGYIPAQNLFIQGRQPYPEYSEQTPSMSQAMKQSVMNYRMGEVGYMLQEWGGFYGFMMGSVREAFGEERDFSPSRPMLQSADRMYGAERGFWDLDLGGWGDFTLPETSVQLSEIVRRFIPHRRRQINEVNDIPNRMPLWLPGAEDVINYQTGDPYVKTKLGEMRLPGSGYESLNDLHPDQFGMYGAYDRFKILADIAPWSSKYHQYRQIMEKSDLTEDMQKRVSEIKKQVAEKRKKIAVSEYMWNGKLGKVSSGQLTMSEEDPNLFTMDGVDSPIRLAGVRFSKTTEGRQQAKAFYEANLKGKNVDVLADTERDIVNDNREKTIDAVVKIGRLNVNAHAIKEIREGRLAGGESQSKNFVDNMVKYSPQWQMLGKVWETMAHAEVPFVSLKIGRMSSAEYYERRMVYGKIWQPWETPISSYLQPMWETYTRDRGLLTVPAAAVLTGWAAGMFFQGGTGLKGRARAIGAVIGGTAGTVNWMRSKLRGQRDVPGRRKREWAVDEYIDTLKYIKASYLYRQARQVAIDQEGIDPEAIVEVLGESAANRRDEFQNQWNDAPMGRKPTKPLANKVFAGIGPATAEALKYRKAISGTMMGFELSDDYMSKTAGIPKRYRPLIEGWLQTPVSERKRLLDIMPKPVRRILEDQWGMPVEEGRDLTRYFKTHELPGPDWEGWLPQVNLDDIQVKVINHEGLDHSEYGYYPNQVNESLMQPWSFPDMWSKPQMSKGMIIEQLQAMGVRDISIERKKTNGAGRFFINLVHDRRDDVVSQIEAGLA